ncbi:DUF1003 domain-containing protein [Carnobacterium maltaromaticum]|uniref:DUF1003 domain-containing protein n=1 Tax=Carnobacterium maltaromaticum TaxID=2751 RepID=A0AAW9JTN7_CARML|nr:DUF1003 domain-containing protein [Carnobacterium maltaromaticum]MDZ5757969.1 DUF1003 domain-containing protein [Carnobacterium maltaromaticum]
MKKKEKCIICHKDYSETDGLHLTTLSKELRELILSEHPEFSEEAFICMDDLMDYRLHYIKDMIKTDSENIESLNKNVLDSIKEGMPIAKNTNEDVTTNLTLGEKVADGIAKFGGSWGFIFLFLFVLVAWIIINSIALFTKPFDPYPFILLNLILSCLAAIQAPVIMMSQNRQEKRDRQQSDSDYQVNLKSEIEIRLLHEKMDHMLTEQWEHLVNIQNIQVDLLNELQERMEVLEKKSLI